MVSIKGRGMGSECIKRFWGSETDCGFVFIDFLSMYLRIIFAIVSWHSF